eukprot:scaffold87586_cov32-Tisochrysis_lutea.AAC.1
MLYKCCRANMTSHRWMTWQRRVGEQTRMDGECVMSSRDAGGRECRGGMRGCAADMAAGRRCRPVALM